MLSVQLKDVLTRTIDAWVDLFDESNKETLPQLCMELVNESGQMSFFPTYEQLEELILFVVQQIANTLQMASPRVINSNYVNELKNYKKTISFSLFVVIIIISYILLLLSYSIIVTATVLKWHKLNNDDDDDDDESRRPPRHTYCTCIYYLDQRS